MWNNKKVSVILPTYNEKGSIREFINNLYATGYVDEVIVVNNNAIAGTEEEVLKTKAIHIKEEKQGYGYAIQRGYKEASGDLLITIEPDGTFEAKDILKLLVYSDEFEAVWGTRTNIALIKKGANMKFLIRCGNVYLAKCIQFLFNCSRLTDVGCTMKLYRREVIENLMKYFTVGREHFGPELMILTILGGFSYIEIPITYQKRIGKSSVTGSKIKAMILGCQMFIMVHKYFIKKYLGLNININD